MRCDKKVVSVSAPQRARNEHKEVEALRRETVLSDNNLSRSYTGGAGVLERFFSLEGACGRKERIKRSCIPGSKTVCQTVHTCVSGVNVQERSVRGELIVKRLSTGRVQIVHWRVPTVNERNPGGRAPPPAPALFFGGAPKNLEDDASMRYHQMQVNLSEKFMNR